MKNVFEMVFCAIFLVVCAGAKVGGAQVPTSRQTFTIDEDGTFKIEKHGHWLSRSTNCVITLDGRVIQERHP